MIYCEFIVKIMCTYRNEKKKKKKRIAIVAMVLPK